MSGPEPASVPRTTLHTLRSRQTAAEWAAEAERYAVAARQGEAARPIGDGSDLDWLLRTLAGLAPAMRQGEASARSFVEAARRGKAKRRERARRRYRQAHRARR